MKTYKIKVRSRISHGNAGKTVYRELEIMAGSKKDAVEKTKQEMLKTTYRQFFPDFNAHGSSWYTYGITSVFPYKGNFIPLSKEEMMKKVDTFIDVATFEKVDIYAELKK